MDAVGFAPGWLRTCFRRSGDSPNACSASTCSLLLPEYTWLATGGKSQFNDRLMVLKGRKVTAFSVIARRNSIPRRTAADSFSYIGFSQRFATIRLRVYPNRPSHSSCCFHWSLAV